MNQTSTWEGSKEQAEFINQQHNAVLDVLIAADMWGNPQYKGKSAAELVQLLVDRAEKAEAHARESEHIANLIAYETPDTAPPNEQAMNVIKELFLRQFGSDPTRYPAGVLPLADWLHFRA